MKKAFTLIELIVVIVIIGILAAVAIPKYNNLKANAEINALAKITNDISHTIQASYTNLTALDNKDYTTITLKELVGLNGKDWYYRQSGGGSGGGVYYYYYYKTRNNSGKSPATILFRTGTDILSSFVEVKIECDKFENTLTKEKCQKHFGEKGRYSTKPNLNYYEKILL